MRYLLMLVIFGLVPYLAYGASEYDTAEQHELVSQLQSDVNLIRSRDIEKIRNFIKNEDTDFITGISDMSDEEQVPLMRSWLAKRTFKFYYDKYMAEIKSQSEKTGRKIKTETHQFDEKSYIITYTYYWLDRGKLDEKECERELLKRRACDYPDGFEEYEISYRKIEAKNDYHIVEHFTINKDDVAANSNKYIWVDLTSASTKSANINDWSFSINAGGQAEKYEAHHKWRNQEVADIRAGKYRKPTKEERAKYNVFKISIVSDDSRKWDSNELFPAAAVTSINADYSARYTHN